jgi:hypothetical protein
MSKKIPDLDPNEFLSKSRRARYDIVSLLGFSSYQESTRTGTAGRKHSSGWKKSGAT